MEAISCLVVLAMLVLLGVALVLHLQRSATQARTEKREAEERFRPYQEAWTAARVTDNIDVLVRCGDYLIKAARNWQPHLLSSVAWEVYQELLKRLKTHPDLKPIALEVGRSAYAARRADGALTIYDEQAIQNDILVHLS